MALPQLSPNQQQNFTTTTRTSYIPTTPQLRRYADYTHPSVSPQMPRRSSPSKSGNYGRMSPTKQQNYGLPMKLAPPMSDIDSVQLPQILYLQKSPLETHKCRMQNKLKFALLTLTVLCFISSVTAYFGYIYAFSNEYDFNRKVYGTDDKPDSILGYQVYLIYALKQSIFVASWSTFFSSLGTLFVVGNQLYFALKIVKNQPDSPQLALNFLAAGKYVQTVTMFVWFLSFICFIFLTSVTTVHFVALQVIPKAIATSVGIIVAVLCLIAAFQAFFQMHRIDYVIPTHFSMDERFDLDAVGGGNYARGVGNNMNFSTLV